MRRLILCFDGTWNRPTNNCTDTNVCKIFNSIDEQGADDLKQIKYYHSGVGVHWYDRLAGGVLGLGLSLNVIHGYRWLARHYDDGDEIFLFGFSRGAYTARSLAGLIRKCGLLKKDRLSSAVRAYLIYIKRDKNADTKKARMFRALFSYPQDKSRIKFIGVWDTVGALGIPLRAFNFLNRKLFQFHDTKLSRIVEHGYQAIAIDEYRVTYKPALWAPRKEVSEQKIEQCWFLGAHSDVGGGYVDTLLSDITLHWMQERAASCGLRLKIVQPDVASYLGPIHPSYSTFLKGLYCRVYSPYYRAVGTRAYGSETIHDSVCNRCLHDAEYRKNFFRHRLNHSILQCELVKP